MLISQKVKHRGILKQELVVQLEITASLRLKKVFQTLSILALFWVKTTPIGNE